jgi:hypothetical protein
MFQPSATRAIRRAISVGAVAVLAAAQACASDSTTSPHSNNNSDPKGTYTLQTVDGKSVPHQISWSPYYDRSTGHFYNEFDVVVTDGGIKLDDQGFIDIWLNFAITGDGVPMNGGDEVKGLYEVNGSQVIVTFDGTNWEPLQLQNGQISIPTDVLGKGVTNTYVFKR